MDSECDLKNEEWGLIGRCNSAAEMLYHTAESILMPGLFGLLSSIISLVEPLSNLKILAVQR